MCMNDFLQAPANWSGEQPLTEAETFGDAYEKINQLGGCDASDEWSKGWDAAVTAALEILERSNRITERAIHQAKLTIAASRCRYPETDKVASWFIDNCFYELKWDSKKKQWRLTEYKKTEEVVIDDDR